MNFTYTDIHCHILPGVDDGAESIEQSMQMLEIAYEEGCRQLVLTPHYERGRNRYEAKQLEEIFIDLKLEAFMQFPNLQLYLGNELLYEPGVLEDMKDGLVHTMAGTRYLLVEFNIRISYPELYQAMKELTQARFYPIVAHVERYWCLTKHIERLQELENLGVYFQMNAESVLGSVFDENVRWCRKLLKERYISFMGTDAHNLDSRGPHMREALEWMNRKLDASYVEAVTQDYPTKMLAGEYLD